MQLIDRIVLVGLRPAGTGRPHQVSRQLQLRIQSHKRLQLLQRLGPRLGRQYKQCAGPAVSVRVQAAAGHAKPHHIDAIAVVQQHAQQRAIEGQAKGEQKGVAVAGQEANTTAARVVHIPEGGVRIANTTGAQIVGMLLSYPCISINQWCIVAKSDTENQTNQNPQSICTHSSTHIASKQTCTHTHATSITHGQHTPHQHTQRKHHAILIARTHTHQHTHTFLTYIFSPN